MAARKTDGRRAPADRLHVLPRWMKDEDMLRRMLAMRRDGASLDSLRKACGATGAEWSRARAVARHSRHRGDKAVAEAFFARFDSYAVSRYGQAPMFSPEDGARLARDIARWTINGPSLTVGEAEAEAAEEAQRAARRKGK